jgi:hypothetical protein
MTSQSQILEAQDQAEIVGPAAVEFDVAAERLARHFTHKTAGDAVLRHLIDHGYVIQEGDTVRRAEVAK